MTYKEILPHFRYRRRQRIRWSYSIHFNKYPNKITMDYYTVSALITWYQNGWILVNFKGYKSYHWKQPTIGFPRLVTDKTWHVVWSDRNCANRFLPEPWRFTCYRYHLMISRPGEEPHESPCQVLISPKGELSNRTKKLLGKPLSELKKFYVHHDRLRDKPRKRGRYWRARARNLFRDSSECKYANSHERFWKCNWFRSRFSRELPRQPITFECGCRLYRKKQPRFTKTVQQILREPNATVRASMIKIFGVQEFFNKVTARTLDAKGDYKLLAITTVFQRQTEPQLITALKMICPSTNQVYIHLVHNGCRTVNQALDYIYNIRNFTERVGIQT